MATHPAEPARPLFALLLALGAARASAPAPAPASSPAPALGAAPPPCAFSFPGGLSYDLSALAAYSAQLPPTPFLASNTGNPSDPYKYGFAFCQDMNLGIRCGLTGSFSLQAGAQCVRNFGSSAQAVAAPLTELRTDGISLTYPGGFPCGNQYSQAQTTFRIGCLAGGGGSGGGGGPYPGLLVIDSLTVQTDPSTCGLTYELRSPAGCGVVTPAVSDPFNALAVAFAGVVGAVAFYLGAGIAYKRHTLGARGLEAVPNIDTWRRVYAACAGCSLRGAAAGGSAYKGVDDGSGPAVDYALYDDDVAPVAPVPPAPAGRLQY